MNKLERFVYDKLKHNAALKIRVRDFYQGIMDLVPQKSFSTPNEFIAREGFFFGFHDKIPFSDNDEYLAALKAPRFLRMPKKGEAISIGYFSGDNWSEFKEVAKTKAWNWHQGCMLQWLGRKQILVYNDIDKDRIVSKSIDVLNGNVAEFSDPVASASYDGSIGIGYDFRRVEEYMSGYGYNHGKSENLDSPIPKTSYLYGINFSSGKRFNIISLEEVVNFNNSANTENYYHWLSHVIFSPDGKRVLFMLRWVKSRESQGTRWSRLFAVNIDGTGLYEFPCNGMVSHIGWRNNQEVIAYCRIDGVGDNYYIMKDMINGHFELIGPQYFKSDGHPSFSFSGRFMITDSYPDRFRQQRLSLYDYDRNSCIDLGKFYHHKKFTSSLGNHIACDLHPRWNRSGTYICFDSVYSGKRSLVTMDLREFVESDSKYI
ncbi:hypothetical protein OAV76_01735 [Schleiferiaceae bacterium]|nr:hypothetical protein [Schleiferiaceae bacterium]